MPKKRIDYRALQAELQLVIQQLEQPDTDVDQAISLYKRGQEIIASLAEYLQTAETTIKQVTAKEG